jgi:dihydropteroate synthase
VTPPLAERFPAPAIMGVINVTPDSFSDGGDHLEPEAAIAYGLELQAAGADIIDIGGESTRPGSKVAETGLPADEELRRVIPVLNDVLREAPQAIISVDTYKAEVAHAALDAGAQIINDVSALRWDPKMATMLSELSCGVVLMHARGKPEEWRTQDASRDIVAEVKRDLRAWSDAAVSAGIARDRMVLDPGFGFGKRFAENYPLLAGFADLDELGFPLLSGTSRKSFIGRTLARNGQEAPAGERLYGTLATLTASVLGGADIVRVHDVKAAVEAVAIADEILNARE